MKISEFVGNLKGGLSRTNRFVVDFSAPKSVKIDGMIPQQKLLMLCDIVQLPGLNVNTTQTPNTSAQIFFLGHQLHLFFLNFRFLESYVKNYMLLH